jgi:hypothetical protein
LTSDEKKRSLVQYRVKQAEESLEEAEFLFQLSRKPIPSGINGLSDFSSLQKGYK